MKIYKEEIFGPVMSLMKFKSVVLPEPDGPTIMATWPGAIVNERSFITG